MSAITDLPRMIPAFIESGCDINSDKACVSYDFSYYDDYNYTDTDYDFYGENSTSHYYDDYYYEIEYCQMKPLLHIAVAMNSTDFLRALKEVAM